MTRPIILATGGTGGHIFPALALARELQARRHRVLLFTNRLTGCLKDQMGYVPIRVLPAGTMFRPSLVRSLWGLMTLGYACVWALLYFMRFRPRLVIGFGGYPSFAPVLIAHLLRLPTLVHEQNRVMGRANRLLTRFAVPAALSFAQTEHIPSRAAASAVVTGNPLRVEFLGLSKRAYKAPSMRGDIRLLIIGGSQGAQLFSKVMPSSLGALAPALRRRLHVMQQAARRDLSQLLKAYRAANIPVELREFFADLPQRMAQAHLVIARSGATTIAELMALGRPSLLVPLAISLDDDQKHNAKALVRRQACVMMTERAFRPQAVSAQLTQLLNDADRLRAMAQAARRHGQTNATARLADYVESRLSGGKQHANARV